MIGKMLKHNYIGELGIMKRKNNKKLYIGIGLLIVILTIIMIPYIKLFVYTHNYELMGSNYIILDREDSYKSGESVQLSTISKSYTDKSIQLTNILYYKELKQLSFGFITDNKSNYDIKIVHKGNEIGKLMTAGKINYYNKSLERLYLFMDEYLLEDEEYSITIINDENTIVGTINLCLPK